MPSETWNYEPVEEFENLRQSAEIENEYKDKEDAGAIEGEESKVLTTADAEKGGPGDHSWGGYEEQQKSEAGSGVQKPAHVSQEDWDARPQWSRPLEDILHAGSAPAAGVADFISDAVGLVPWLKPLDEWWDKHAPRHNNPAIKLTRDASSIIIPTLVGGGAVVGGAKTATASMALPSYMRTLGSVAAYTGVDTGVAMISSHSKTDDNMAATLNNWIGWNIPWATRSTDSPDVRWKTNVFEAAGLAGSVELLGLAFAAGRRTKLIPRDEAARASILNKADTASQYDNPWTEAVDGTRLAKEAAEFEEAKNALKHDPTGSEYNPFINDLGPDDVGRATINTQPDPIMAKVQQAQIQGDFDTINGRTVPVVNETFNREFASAINGLERGKKLDDLFNRISPNVDAVINGKTLRAEDMNRAVDNLTNAIFGSDIPLKEFEFIVDDMKSTVFNSNAFLDEEQWVIASSAFKTAYERLFDPNLRRASAMLTQQAADNVTDAAAAIRMLGDEVDTSRQMGIILDKMNLLGQEVEINNYIVKKAREYQKLKAGGDVPTVVDWMTKQGDDFDEYIRHIKATGNKLRDELDYIAKQHPQYYKPFVEAYDASNGSIDELHKLKRVAESNIGLLKKGFVDGEPNMPSMLVKQIHAARINGLLMGLAPVRAMVGNSMLTAIKPASIFAGAFLQGNTAAFKRAQYTFGGIEENFRRGLQMLQKEWNFARLNPEEAMMRGRHDLMQAKMDQLEYMDSMAEGWKRAKEPGWRAKVALWNMTKGVSWWNKQQFVKLGTNALYAIDGMTNSFMASGIARAKAYDELFDASRGSIDFDAFTKRQRELYEQAFDESGKLTDEAARHASREIALNLDNEVVKKFEDFLDGVPAARGIFLFPRTGVNAAQLSWTFNPLSSLGLALPKVKRVMRAVTKQEKLAVLAEHGIAKEVGRDMDLAFDTLKSEYIGRQIMGNTVAMGAGIWALQGNLTGSGPQDGAERARMMRMGWQPFSVKNPITGEWRSYKGFEPFAQILGLTADVVFQANRVDQSVTEDIFRKISASISMNVTNNTFVGGFEPLVGLLTGDATGWNRFWAQQTSQLVPFKGIRSILNNAISPQLRDVNNDFMSYLANGDKWLMAGGQNSSLPNLLDVYTGKPVRYQEPVTAAANALLPFFKQNGDMEPWRQWLLSTGWDGLQRIRTNKYTKEPLSPQDRNWINNWIAKNANLKGQVLQLMTYDDGFFQKKMKEYVKYRGIKNQNQYPVKEHLVHRELDRIHDTAFESAWNALEAYKAQFTTTGQHIKMRNFELRKGKSKEAAKTQLRILDLQKMSK